MDDVQILKNRQSEKIQILKAQHQQNMESMEAKHKEELINKRSKHELELEKGELKFKNEKDKIVLSGKKEIDHTRNSIDTQIENYQKTAKQRLNEIEKKNNLQIEQTRANNREILKNETQAYDVRIKNVKQEIEDAVSEIKNSGESYKNKIIEENTSRLADLNKAEKDPFYKLVLGGLKVEENNEEYIATARVPEHEKNNVKITVGDGQIRLFGARSKEIRYVDEEGGSKEVSSRNFNTFFESIPIKRKIDDKKITQTYQNGLLTLKIPKV